MSQQEFPLTRPQLAESLVQFALGRLLGTPVTAVEPLAGSVDNQDFMIRTATGDFIFKAGEARSLAVEAWACEQVRTAGVRTSEVVALELDRAVLPAAFLLLRSLPGAGLEPTAHPAFVEAGRALRLVHTLSASGYGCIRHNPDEIAGPHGSWAHFVAEPLDCLAELVSNSVLDGGLAQRLESALRRYGDAVRFEQPGVLLHGDLKPAHVFAEGDRFVGLIDWGDVAVGDPLYDLARFSIVGAEPLADLLTGYGLSMDAELSVRFAVYRLVRMTLTLRDELRAGGDWFASYRATIESDLALLG
jgi:aminoglycoside phosphotransferase (APT) family kinase protein